MAIEEPGVLWRDGIYFWQASAYAKAHLFYPMWGATYNLDVPYRIYRTFLEAYMVQYIVRGELHFDLRGHHFVAKEGEIVLLSSREFNHYWSECPAQVKWFHFHGRGVEEMLEYAYEKNGSGHFGREVGNRAVAYVDEVLWGLKERSLEDFRFSRAIYSLLCEMAAPAEKKLSTAEEAVSKAVHYMKNNYQKQLTVEDIAQHAGMSTYHFARQFKRAMLSSPHQYLLDLRLEQAKKLLVYTNETVESIASQAGFQSSSYFIRAFRHSMNMTPSAFRTYFVPGEEDSKK